MWTPLNSVPEMITTNNNKPQNGLNWPFYTSLNTPQTLSWHQTDLHDFLPLGNSRLEDVSLSSLWQLAEAGSCRGREAASIHSSLGTQVHAGRITEKLGSQNI